MSLLTSAQILETYAFYDRPLLFSCKDDNDKLYLALLTEETDELDKWLYVPMSPERYNHIRAGDIGIRQAFTQAERDIIELTSKNAWPHRPIVRSLTPDELDLDDLPAPDEKLINE